VDGWLRASAEEVDLVPSLVNYDTYWYDLTDFCQHEMRHDTDLAQFSLDIQFSRASGSW
jgi:hypothetical protein